LAFTPSKTDHNKYLNAKERDDLLRTEAKSYKQEVTFYRPEAKFYRLEATSYSQEVKSYWQKATSYSPDTTSHRLSAELWFLVHLFKKITCFNGIMVRESHLLMCYEVFDSQSFVVKLIIYTNHFGKTIIGKAQACTAFFKGIVVILV